MTKSERIKKAYEIAREEYAAIGVDTEVALEKMKQVSISLHCWQADDVGGFERPDSELAGGGIQVTGNYPGKATTIAELRQDLEKVYTLLPGNNRFNMHASYGDFGDQFVDRDAIEIKHFESWVDWAKANNLKLDFNSTCFSHPKSADGYTLSSKDDAIREFWKEHVKRCREVSAYMGEQLGSPTIHNIWLPDGSKDHPVDRFGYRAILKDSLDEVLSKKYDPAFMKDAVEAKLFGIGSEAYVVGSHEFYMGYAISRNTMLCLDIGHFHPTESVADKVSAVFQYIDSLLFHVTRGIRWDSDHVVALTDDVKELMQEIVRADALGRVNIGLDFFDASINRIGAYVVGTRAAQQAVLFALLEPLKQLRDYENAGKYFERLALLEVAKSKPFGAVWDYLCLQEDVPVGEDYIAEIQSYEKDVLSKRS